jgi:hypothetical protein
MDKIKKLADLEALTRMTLDHRLAALRRAKAEKRATTDMINALDLPYTETDLPLAAAQHAEMMYQAWADQRRMQLNLQLARQSVIVLHAEADARQAFGKNNVLAALQVRAKLRSN